MRKLAQDFVSYLVMRSLGRIVRSTVRRLFVLAPLLSLGSWGLYRHARVELQESSAVICSAGGDVLDAIAAVHASRWAAILRDACVRADLAVRACLS